jgi:hypothetical protein
MTEAILNIIGLNGEVFLEVFQKQFDWKNKNNERSELLCAVKQAKRKPPNELNWLRNIPAGCIPALNIMQIASKSVGKNFKI